MYDNNCEHNFSAHAIGPHSIEYSLFFERVLPGKVRNQPGYIRSSSGIILDDPGYSGDVWHATPDGT